MMTDAPKRRGRPPGIKNKPKPLAIPINDSPDAPIFTAHPTERIELSAVDTTFPVLLSIRRAFGDPQDTIPVDWPVNWRLPQQGDAIHVRNDWGGIVQSVDFDLGSRRVILHLR